MAKKKINRKALAQKIAKSLFRKIQEMEGYGIHLKTGGRIGEAHRLLCDAHWKMDLAAQ